MFNRDLKEFLMFGNRFFIDPPVSTTTNFGLGKWDDGDTPGAAALNANWDQIDKSAKTPQSLATTASVTFNDITTTDDIHADGAISAGSTIYAATNGYVIGQLEVGGAPGAAYTLYVSGDSFFKDNPEMMGLNVYSESVMLYIPKGGSTAELYRPYILMSGSNVILGRSTLLGTDIAAGQQLAVYGGTKLGHDVGHIHRITGSVAIVGSIETSGEVTVGDTLTVNGISTLSGLLIGGAPLSPKDLYILGTTYLSGSVSVSKLDPTENNTIPMTGSLSIESGYGVILKSPDGSQWKIVVDNAGALSATAA